MSSTDAVRAVKINLWGSEKEATYHLAIDQGGGKRLSGLVFTQGLAQLARKLKLPTVTPSDEDRAHLDRALADDPKLKERFDLTAVFRADVNGVVLKGMTLHDERPEAVVVLVDGKASPGSTAILQVDAQGAIAGGFTIRVPFPEQPVA